MRPPSSRTESSSGIRLSQPRVPSGLVAEFQRVRVARYVVQEPQPALARAGAERVIHNLDTLDAKVRELKHGECVIRVADGS